MNGTKIFTLKAFSLLAFAAASYAAVPEYFPLQPGNSWAYRVTQGRQSSPGTINIGDIRTVQGRQYYEVQFFERNVLIRQDADGSLFAWDRETNTESLWLPFAAETGQTVATSFDTCSRNATVQNRNAKLTTDIGQVENALELRYTANCADAGANVQYFVPYVGMIRYETSSIAGPVTYDLMYSRTGLTNIDAKVNAFTLALDSGSYKAGSTTEALARVTFRVSEPVKLIFPSGQSTDLRITSESGESVYVWSADKLFTAIYREEVTGPGDRSWVMSFPIGRLQPGKYKAEGWLTTNPRQYSAVVGFEIVR